jgi:hypothetical protein
MESSSESWKAEEVPDCRTDMASSPWLAGPLVVGLAIAPKPHEG